MPTKNIVRTKLLRFYDDADDAAIAEATDASITYTMETIDITTKDSPNHKEYAAGDRDTSGSISGVRILPETNGLTKLNAAWKTHNTTLTLVYTTGETGFEAATLEVLITNISEDSSGSNAAGTYSVDFQAITVPTFATEA